MTKFEEFKSNLQKAKVSGVLLLEKNDDREVLIVSLGYNYPDSAAEKVWRVAEKMQLPYNEFEVCAEAYGANIIKRERF
jgi:hypothetical protein